jgi:hypothetical protein
MLLPSHVEEVTGASPTDLQGWSLGLKVLGRYIKSLIFVVLHIVGCNIQLL